MGQTLNIPFLVLVWPIKCTHSTSEFNPFHPGAVVLCRSHVYHTLYSVTIVSQSETLPTRGLVVIGCVGQVYTMPYTDAQIVLESVTLSALGRYLVK